jgi:hypothetical protein
MLTAKMNSDYSAAIVERREHFKRSLRFDSHGNFDKYNPDSYSAAQKFIETYEVWQPPEQKPDELRVFAPTLIRISPNDFEPR